MEIKQQWEYLHKPAAELVAQVANPQVFRVYFDNLKKEKRRQSENRDEGFYESKGKDQRSENYHSESDANTYYDPLRGLVDKNGTVLVPKEHYDKLLGIDGIAISY